MHMKTMLIPVDFTDTSKNAVAYAAEWAKTYGYERIILLRAMYNSVFDNLIPSAGYVSVNQEYLNDHREQTEEQLNGICKNLAEMIGPGIKISMAISELPLVRSILELIEDEHPQLVVAGSDNAAYSSNSFVGGNIISIAKISPVKVLIVPSHYRYQPVAKALVPVNFDMVDTLENLNKHAATSPQFNPELLVLNVDPKEKYLNPDEKFKRTEGILHNYLQNFKHELMYSNHKNIIDGLVEFADAHTIQLVIALPGKHSFLYSLTHKSISEAIYANARQPVLILK